MLDEEARESERLSKIISDSPVLISTAEEGYAPVHRAARNGHLRVLEFLLKNGVDIDHETVNGTALSIAAQYGRLKACEYLITSGVDIECGSPLGEAIVSGFQSVGRLLLNRNATPNGIYEIKNDLFRFDGKKRERRIMMLDPAVLRDGHPFVKLLHEWDANLNLVAAEGEPAPLIWAIDRDQNEIFALLSLQGADVSAVVGQYPSAFH
ncbi:ankyrin repeat domain-containing protein [Verrucomicrobiales bacterium]|nr:ankyrin repeat domain-containing protein [Verrucomicrobiales bacterium]MDB4468017.1 ankyrin repeat domain-containing protein [Verrucomicrobiales bacterium]MDB4789503.1 ankyrin repeat domain-containing protein [Verrucomicrobiales bacterium]MDC0504092.1 ankyrin repeat domain-containing protein [Verrucomicrobiales bacterium]